MDKATRKTLLAAKAYLGGELAVLSDVLRRSSGFPPGVLSARYRANHPHWIDALNRLESNQLFLARSVDGTQYRLRASALPLLKEKRAVLLLEVMEALFAEFREIYREKLGAPIKMAEIVELAKTRLHISDLDLLREALYYMRDSHGIWSGVSNDFPIEDQSTINISEDVLRKKSFLAQLVQIYEWHIVNPQRTAQRRNVNILGMPIKARTRKVKREKKGRSPFLRGPGASLPEWYGKLQDAQKALIQELDQAMKYRMAALPTMGLRTLLELVMRDHIPDRGTFKGNLEAFEIAGFVTKQQASLIGGVIDAGNAAAHRAYFPNPSDLRTCIDAVRHLMEGIYILKPKIEAVVKNTPKKNK